MAKQSPTSKSEAVRLDPPIIWDHKSLIIMIGLSLAIGTMGGFLSPHVIDRFNPVMTGLLLGLSFFGLTMLIASLLGQVRLGAKSPTVAFYDGIIDAVTDACVVTDTKSRAIYGNAGYLKLLSENGIKRLVGFDMLYAGHSMFAEPIYQLNQAALQGKSESREVRIPPGASAAGAHPTEPRWVRIYVSPVKSKGRHNYTLWRSQDLTIDRNRQEQAFGRLQFIITYLDHAPAGFFSTLPNGKIDYLNATLAEWLGFDLAESQDGKLQLHQVLGEEGARQLRAIEPLKSGSVIESFELDIKNTTGKTLPMQIIHRIDFDAAGEILPARTLVLQRPPKPPIISDNQTLAQFAASAPIGVATIDAEGVIRNANTVFLSYSPLVKRGTQLEKIVIPTDQPLLQETLQNSRISAETLIFDATLADKKGKIIQFSVMPLETGATLQTIFALDKTENKALEVQLAQSQKMQAVGQLASGIAHDFNNVLTPIIGFADLLLAKLRPTDPAFADIMNIKQNANRAANLVRQLLAFSRKQTLQPKVHSLTEAMSDLGNLLGRVLGEKVGLKISHSRDLGLVMVDINQFEQVIINLAVNARDAMPEGGTLYVQTSNVRIDNSKSTSLEPMPAGDYLLCAVTDTGTGIPAEILAKIWEPFFSTKEIGKGTGLGLSTVYGIVKQTGGFIFCESTIGKGTTFNIYLPRYYPPKLSPAITEAKQTTVEKQRSDMTGNGRILLVEDEDAVRAFAVRALTSRGYTVIEADSGESALEAIEVQEQGFDLILSDVVMPEMDGPTLLRELRKRQIMTKVIFVSGYAEDAFEKNLEGQTDFAFLPKPFSLKQLVEKVKEVMNS